MTRLNAWKIVCTVVVLCVATAVATSAQTLATLDFDSHNGAGPQYMSLTQGRDGNLYGTTSYGGVGDCFSNSFTGCGTVFRMTPDGKLATLYSFCGQANCQDGSVPFAGLLLATDGNFYGTTRFGGTGGKCDNGGYTGCGTVFKITPKGVLTTLYNFCTQANCTDGFSPQAALIQATDGNFYGTTLAGGDVCQSDCGTIFRITPAGKLTTLYSFCSQPVCADGASPAAGLVQGTDGNFYGTTEYGNAYRDSCGIGCGTVFKITPAGKLTTLYSFCAESDCPDGALPIGSLAQAADGNLYGTTYGGGYTTACCGTVFRITRRGKLTTAYRFCAQVNCPDGKGPAAGLVHATDGNLYGTTIGGGANTSYGTVFEITPGGIVTTLYNFCTQESCSDGAAPFGGLLQATNGALYGSTYEGGTYYKICFNGCGTEFSLGVGLDPFVAFVHDSGRVGQAGGILGQGFTGTTSVTLNGTPASFTVVSDTYIRATVPAGATTGYITVTTPSGTLTSNVPFHVIK